MKKLIKTATSVIAIAMMLFAFVPTISVSAAEGTTGAANSAVAEGTTGVADPAAAEEITFHGAEFKAAANEEFLPPGVTQIASSNTLLGVKGSYENAPAEKLLKRINQIRKEAYDEGLASSYVPIKWSDALEFIAQIRSVEASVYEDHVRPKGGYVFVMNVNGVSSYAENLAWGGDALDAVEMWYDEKADLVNKTGGVTGHYESLIDPSYKYIGIGSFQRKGSWNSVCAEFTTGSGINEGRTDIYGDCIQLIEIPKKDISVSISGGDAVTAGADVTYSAKAVYTGEDAYGRAMESSLVIPEITWTSSDESIATVSEGKVSGLVPGNAVITAEAGFYGNSTGLTASKEVTVKEPSNPDKVTVKLIRGKKSFTAKWSDAGTQGYQVQYSLNGKFKSGVKTKNISGKTSVTVKGLKSGKKYYVRVRSYNKTADKTYWSKWSSVKSVKTK